MLSPAHTIRRTREGYLYCAPRLLDVLAAFVHPSPTVSPCPATPPALGVGAKS